MISISQKEAKMLREHGRGEDIHMSSRNKKSRGKRYFLTESYKSMKILNGYRKANTLETHEKE